MEKIYQGTWPEIVFASRDPQISRKVNAALKSGILRKIAPRLYSPDLDDDPKYIVTRNLYHILSHLFPKAVITHRSALEGGPTPDGTIFLTYKYTKKVQFPGLTVRLLKGESNQPGDTPFMGDLFLASRPRAFLENMQPSRGSPAKVLASSEIEARLDKLRQIHGNEELNKLRDNARKLSKSLHMEQEYINLNRMISGLLATHDYGHLQTEQGRTRALGYPYDTDRIELFARLFAYLQHSDVPLYPNNIMNETAWRTLAFFEAYFSNYIEGTEFFIEEARDIVFKNKIDPKRPEDSHDILGTYKLVSSKNLFQTPNSDEELLQKIKGYHAILMEGRQELYPGQFKEKKNRAGETIFVSPENVIGTLKKGFRYYRELPEGIHRAVFMMFLISEVHPFKDGNGRLARVMMNAELVYSKQSKIIIPTVYREDYLLALRALSRQSRPEPYVNMLSKAQRFTASIPFDSYEKALKALQTTNAFKEPHEAKLRLLSQKS